MRPLEGASLCWCALFKSQCFCFIMSRLLCWLCYKIASPNLKGIVKHMAAVHAHDPIFHIYCGIGGCARTYTNFYSFKKHLYRRHRESLEMAGPFTTTSENPSTHTGGVGTDETLWDAGDSDVQPELEQGSNTFTRFQQKKQMALFLLKTKEVRKFSKLLWRGSLKISPLFFRKQYVA